MESITNIAFFVAIVCNDFRDRVLLFFRNLESSFSHSDDFISLENSFENEVVFGVVNNLELLIW